MADTDVTILWKYPGRCEVRLGEFLYALHLKRYAKIVDVGSVGNSGTYCSVRYYPGCPCLEPNKPEFSFIVVRRGWRPRLAYWWQCMCDWFWGR